MVKRSETDTETEYAVETDTETIMDEEEDFDIELEGLEEDSTRVSHKRKREDSGSEAESEDVELAVVQKLCGHCHVDLAASIHFKCAICKHTLLCVDCFSCGVEFARHQNNHDYQVIVSFVSIRS